MSKKKSLPDDIAALTTDAAIGEQMQACLREKDRITALTRDNSQRLRDLGSRLNELAIEKASGQMKLDDAVNDDDDDDDVLTAPES